MKEKTQKEKVLEFISQQGGKTAKEIALSLQFTNNYESDLNKTKVYINRLKKEGKITNSNERRRRGIVYVVVDKNKSKIIEKITDPIIEKTIDNIDMYEEFNAKDVFSLIKEKDKEIESLKSELKKIRAKEMRIKRETSVITSIKEFMIRKKSSTIEDLANFTEPIGIKFEELDNALIKLEELGSIKIEDDLYKISGNLKDQNQISLY